MNQAYEFSLPDQNGSIHTLKDYTGTWLILYFYPKDETPGCTEEACAFRDGRDFLQKAGAEVVGISADSVASHKKFADKNNLTFTLLSDESTEIIKAYGAWGQNKSGEGVLRKTFLISPEGQVVKTYPDVTPSEHVAEVYKDLKAAREASPQV